MRVSPARGSGARGPREPVGAGLRRQPAVIWPAPSRGDDGAPGHETAHDGRRDHVQRDALAVERACRVPAAGRCDRALGVLDLVAGDGCEGLAERPVLLHGETGEQRGVLFVAEFEDGE
jgi:hypothetical protein